MASALAGYCHLWDWDVCIQRVVRVSVTRRNQTNSYSLKPADIKISNGCIDSQTRVFLSAKKGVYSNYSI